ncbi:phage tail tape measure protein [Paenibacillus elgii]|uniref:phage tail tape measure protein n=1 Tax=Paenibacillus elgii TaxID=189691 RepID=UPI0020405706|nr:phage tail tape measure protein [Paenibacillus elgii]MCM3273896.1 phage tail tape measure protein [Paenibacillus elgii]
MADNGDLRILIQGTLDTSAKAVGNLNNQILELSKKVNSLNLNVNVDSQNLNRLANQIDVIQKQLAKQELIPVINAKDVKEKATSVVKDIDAAFSKYKNKGLITVPNKVFDPLTNELKEFSLQVQRADGVVEKLKFDIIKLANGEKITNAFKLAGFKESDKTAQIAEKQLQIQQQTKAKLERLEEARVAAEEKAYQKRLQNLENFKANYISKITDLQRRYGSKIDNQSLNNLKANIGSLNIDSPELDRKMRDIPNKIRQIGAEAKTASAHALNFGEALGAAFVKFPVWLISGTIFVNVTRFFTEGIKYINELNDALTQISIVTNRSQLEVARLGLEYNKLAKEMGVTTKQISEASVEYYRQGLSQAEVMERVKTTTEYAKISNLDFKKSAEILTATTNSMKIGIERASDVFAYLGDATATGADEIGRAFQKTGGTAGALNLEFEKVASWIAVVSSRTREGAETIGQSIKSILARIQNMKEKGFSEEDGTQINEVAKSLNTVGIALVDNNGQFRNFGKVMDELGAKWSSLDSRQKAYLSTTIAGTYQQSRFLNLMEGYKDTIPLYEKALQSAGTTTQKFALYQEGNQAAIDRLKAALEGLWQSTFSSQAITSVANSLASLISSLDSLVKSIGAFPVGVGLATTALLLFSSNVRGFVMTAGTQLLSWLGVSQVNFNTGALAVNRFAYSMGLGATSARVFTTALVGLSRAFLPLAVLSAVTYGISMVAESFMNAREEAKKMEDRNKTIVNSWTTQREAVEKLKNEYIELSNATNGAKNFLNTEQEQKYYEVTSKIAELMPNLVKEIDSKGRYHLKNAEAIQKELENTEKLVTAEQRRQVASGSESFREVLNEKRKFEKELQEVNKKIESGREFYGSFGERKAVKLSESEIETLKVRALGIQAQIADANNKVREQIESLTSAAINLAGTKLDDNLSKELHKIVTSLQLEGLNPEDLTSRVGRLTQIIQKLNLIKEIRSNGSPDSADTAFQEEQNFIKVAKSIGLADEQINKLINSVFGFKKANTETAVDVDQLYKRLAGVYEETVNEVRPLNDAIDKLKQQHSLSSSEISNLLKKYPQLFSAFTTENGLLKINVQALETKRNAVIAGMQDSIKSESNQVKAQEEALLQKLKFYGAEIDAIDSVAKAKEALARASEGLADKQARGELSDQQVMDETNRIFGELGPQVESIAKAKEAMKALQEAAKSNFNFENKINSPKNEKKEAQLKDALDYIELEKEIVNSLNETYEARKKVIDLEKKQIDIIEKQKDYNSAIQKTNELINNQLKALEDLNTANTGITGKADVARMNAINNKDILSDIKRSNPDFALPDDVEEAKKYVREYFDTWFNSSGDASEAYKKFLGAFVERSKQIHDNASMSVEDRNKELDKIEKQKKSIEKLFGVIQVYKQGWTENVNRINEMNTAIDSSRESLNKLRKEAHDIRIAGLDDQLKEIQRTLETLPESSSQYRDELERLIQLNKEKQNVEHQTAEESRARVASGKLSAEQIVYENEMIKSLSNSWWDYQKVIQDNAFKIITSTINTSAESVKKYDDQLQISKDRLGLLKEGTKAYSDELQKQIKLLQDKLAAEEAHENVIRKQMDTVGLTQEQWNNLNQQLKQSVLAQISIASSIKSANQTLKEQLNTIANDVIEIYKEMYEKQKEVALKAIDDELKALEKSHKRKVDLLDEEMKKYEDLVQAKLKALDEQANEEDYQKQLIKLTKERDEIQKQIDTRKLDTSLEGKAKTAELLKQLQEKNDEIDDFQKKNLRETAKKTLQDQLDEKKKSVDEQKKVEDKAYENEKERLDKVKEATEKHYNDLIQDETRFEKIREDIRKGNISKAMSDLSGFRDFVIKNSETIGNGLSNTLIDKIGKVSTKLQEITPVVASQFQQMANDLQDKMIIKMDELISKFRELDNLKFGNLATQLGNVSEIIAQMQKNSQQWYSATPDDQKRLEQENNKLGSSIGAGKNDSGDWVKDGKQLYETFYIPQNDQEKEQIRMMKINSDAWKTALNDRDKKILEEDNQKRGSSIGAIYKNGTWFKNNIPLYHDGGIVGGKGTPLMEKLHKLLNLGSDEQLSILKQGELVIKNNPIDIIGNLINKIKLPDLSNLSLSPNLAAAGNTYHTYHFNIDKVIGDKKGAHDFVAEAFKGMKNKGQI